ncbi:TRAFAC clade GTPase domain-containing protein [Paenibacillus koleovorans]|uniref:TRAFAC clade GTPase domain-containing protein n=1 Tax=Paenibacillus koleovorans TaxID=121608 RepID=UPI000FDC4364|nr:hypothetical protein [Paenibacillus koleovorans]
MLGLIKKLLRPKPEPKKKPPFYSIVCPYCFQKFEPEDVVFRATHTDDDMFSEVVDTKLSNWRKRYKMDEVYRPVVIDPNTIPDENRKYSENVLVGLVDNGGETTYLRLCPDCHNELPVSAGKVPSNIISIVGASQVGKSVFIASLIHTLENTTAANFDASCLAIMNGARFKQRFLEPIFDRGTMIEATNSVEKMEPYMFEFKFKDESKEPLMLVFFDAAGEGMTNREYLSLQAAHIRNSTAILFLVDPLQIKTIREKIRLNLGEDKGEFAGRYDEPKDVISSLYENFIAHEPGGKTDIPTAVVLTKSDMLQFLKEDNSDYIQSNSNVFRTIAHKGYLDVNEFENINGEISRFLAKVDGPFKNAVDAYFSNKAFFAVSALGSNPDKSKLKSVVTPIRVDEPFVWLLHKLGYIDRGGVS